MTYLGAKVEGRHTADYILTESHGSKSRENVTYAQSAVIEPGEVVGIVTASGKYKPLDLSANDGTEVAAGVNYALVNASATEVEGVVSARDTTLIAEQLIWPDGITETQKTTALGQLATHDLIVR